MPPLGYNYSSKGPNHINVNVRESILSMHIGHVIDRSETKQIAGFRNKLKSKIRISPKVLYDAEGLEPNQKVSAWLFKHGLEPTELYTRVVEEASDGSYRPIGMPDLRLTVDVRGNVSYPPEQNVSLMSTDEQLRFLADATNTVMLIAQQLKLGGLAAGAVVGAK